ncbi:MAG: helix-turn-helix transcriptional regulator [Xenococcaceae cyanobacterium MO_167.B52]|nr:helix-turn-helix transcriptional regulator [Xenococcaceae cyanobacterium MO_167.B52]
MMARKPTSDGMEIIDRMIGDDPEMRSMYEQAKVNVHVAQLIYDARTEAGLSQKELAEMVNTTQSVISRLEDADYEGHSLSMLSRVAQALNREVKIDLVPIVPDLENATLPRPSA